MENINLKMFFIGVFSEKYLFSEDNYFFINSRSQNFIEQRFEKRDVETKRFLLTKKAKLNWGTFQKKSNFFFFLFLIHWLINLFRKRIEKFIRALFINVSCFFRLLKNFAGFQNILWDFSGKN